jgi:hypothetical protein
VFTDDETFDEDGTVGFAPGNSVRFHGRGRLAASPNPHLSHGTVVWEVAGGHGQLEGASGLVTSNFLLSDTGELTENQLGLIFAPRR